MQATGRLTEPGGARRAARAVAAEDNSLPALGVEQREEAAVRGVRQHTVLVRVVDGDALDLAIGRVVEEPNPHTAQRHTRVIAAGVDQVQRVGEARVVNVTEARGRRALFLALGAGGGARAAGHHLDADLRPSAWTSARHRR